MRKLKNVSEFNKVLATGVKQIASGKNNIWIASCFAIQHYNDHGDHGCLNQVLEALRSKARIGLAMFVAWVELFTDQKYCHEVKKFVRDINTTKSSRANVEEAIKNCFWDKVEKQTEIKEFDSDDFYKAIMKVINFYSNVDKTKGDEHANAEVVQLKSVVESKAPHLKKVA